MNNWLRNILIVAAVVEETGVALLAVLEYKQVEEKNDHLYSYLVSLWLNRLELQYS